MIEETTPLPPRCTDCRHFVTTATKKSRYVGESDRCCGHPRRRSVIDGAAYVRCIVERSLIPPALDEAPPGPTCGFTGALFEAKE